jgi:hypothetical protein
MTAVRLLSVSHMYPAGARSQRGVRVVLLHAIATVSACFLSSQYRLTTRAGFSPFSVDAKPKHGGDPDFARTVAFAKIRARVEGVRLAGERLGF